jgi:endonuclease/exonuclease/phosphatase family metal-dependent hydrolase
VRALQYNTHLFLNSGLGFNGCLCQDSVRLEVMKERILGGEYDIVGLTEVWANSSKRRLAAGLASKYPHGAWDGNRDIFEVGSGLLLLSRLPVYKTSFTRYRHLAGADALSQKGFLFATIDDTLIVHTHMQSGESPADVAARRSNIQELTEALAAQPYNMPILLIGDLNVVGETAEYAFLTEKMNRLGFTDTYRALRPSEPGYTYDAVTSKMIHLFNAEDVEGRVQQRLEYLFVREMTPAAADVDHSFMYASPRGDMDLSDHYPLEAAFV